MVVEVTPTVSENGANSFGMVNVVYRVNVYSPPCTLFIMPL